MKDQLRDPATEFLSSSCEYEEPFMDFEAIADLALIDRVESRDGEVRTLGTTYWTEIISRLRKQLEEQGEDWSPLQTGMLDTSPEKAEDLLDTLKEFSTSLVLNVQ